MDPRAETKRYAYIDDPGKSPDGIRSVDHFQIGLHILHDRRGHHDDIVRYARQLLDNKVDHLSEGALSIRGYRLVSLRAANLYAPTHVLVLKEFGYTKEQGGGLLRCKRLADVEQKHDPCQQSSTFPRGNG
jgi:hypothetical protein